MIVSTYDAGANWHIASNMARSGLPCASQRSKTAGMQAKYVPKNGIAANIAAKAIKKIKIN